MTYLVGAALAQAGEGAHWSCAGATGPEHRAALAASFPAADLLPADRDYDRFNGSLTTPPCTEGVRWLVMKTAGPRRYP